LNACEGSRLQCIDGILDLADRYDGFVLDAWGTLHAGGPALPEALDAVRRLRERGKRIVVLSNTPQIGPVLADRLQAQGIPRELYDWPVTAGDLAHEALKAAVDPRLGGDGRRVFHLAPERFPDLLPGTPFVPVGRVEDADVVVNGGPARDDVAIEEFAPLLEAAAARGLTMVCANPDRAIVDKGTRKMCAGELAAVYETLGGCVLYYGKPFRDVFDRAVELLRGPRSRILVVGDGLATDIAGAAAAGLDSLLVAGGLDAGKLLTAEGNLVPDLEAVVAGLAGRCEARYALSYLRW